MSTYRNPFATYFKPLSSSELPAPREVIDTQFKLFFVYTSEAQAETVRQHILNEDLYIEENTIYCLQEDDVRIVCFDGYYNAVQITLIRGV